MSLRGLSWLMLAALSISSPLIAGDGPTTAYLARKNKASGAINGAGSHLTSDAQGALSEKYLHDLQGSLRELVGPFHLDGFPAEGTIRPDDLIEGEVGNESLDGLYVESTDGSMQAVVSTKYLLAEWLARTDRSARDPRNLIPLEIGKAFAAELFYTWVFSDDTHYYRMAELPVVLNGRDGVAKAFLYVRTNDTPAPYKPNGIAVAVQIADRVVVIKEGFKDDFSATVMPTCTAQYQRDSATAGVLLKEYQESPGRDQKLFDRYQTLDDAANLAYQKCFQGLVSEQPYYSSLVRRAQALVDRVHY